MSDTPKAGEVWILDNSVEFECVVDVKDRYGNYVWLVDGEYGCRPLYGPRLSDLHRKPAAPPTDVECWTNYYPIGFGYNIYSSAAQADAAAGETRTWRFDAYGNWVPCQGKTVLGPAVKGRP